MVSLSNGMNALLTGCDGVYIMTGCSDDCPAMMDFTIMAENDSMYNTPPCYTIYMCGLVFEKLLAEGGLSGMEVRTLLSLYLTG